MKVFNNCVISPFVSVEMIDTDLLHGYSIWESIPCHAECEQFYVLIGKLEIKCFVQTLQEKYKMKWVNLAKMGATVL